MKRLSLLVSAVLAMVLLIAMAAPAFALHPFCGSGEEYAQNHVVGLAQSQSIAAPEASGEYVHNPGIEHQGFAVCEPPPGL